MKIRNTEAKGGKMMIQGTPKETTQFPKQKTAWWADLGKMLVGLILLLAMIGVGLWSFAMLGTYGQNWYAIFFLAIPWLFGILAMTILFKLDKRFLD